MWIQADDWYYWSHVWETECGQYWFFHKSESYELHYLSTYNIIKTSDDTGINPLYGRSREYFMNKELAESIFENPVPFIISQLI